MDEAELTRRAQDQRRSIIGRLIHVNQEAGISDPWELADAVMIRFQDANPDMRCPDEDEVFVVALEMEGARAKND